MSSFGHIQDMINRIRDNRELNKGRKERYKSMLDAERNSAKFLSTELRHGKKKLTDEDRRRKDEFLKQEAQTRKIRRIAGFLLILFFIIVVILVFKIVQNYDQIDFK